MNNLIKMKNLLRVSYLIALLNLTVTLAPVKAEYKNQKLPTIYSSNSETLSNKRSVYHKILLEITDDYAISEIIIKIPYGLKANNNIRVRNSNGENIKITTSIKGQELKIGFLEKYQKNDILKINLDNLLVKGIPNGWTYKISVIVPEMNKEIPIGTAFVRVLLR
ncbi:MAG: hypothetical protein Cpurp_04850 [Chlorogloea purpurea SAG 13.99]|nr:hypothetical protein [Chlorogloea purpurea SAG 13.99]